MGRRASFAAHSRERGQTILLVAIAIVSLLAMAALSIDVVTLYVAKSEAQRAADAAALVGGKALVDSGVVSDPTNTSFQTLAQNMANAEINAILQENKIGGIAPAVVGSASFDFTTYPGNPRVTVTLQRTDLPMFFARIWRRTSVTVTASATAEAYNPSGAPANYVPITQKGVKPWLVPNSDPNHGGAAFVAVSNGLVPTGVVGEDITLKVSTTCPPGGSPCDLPLTLPSPLFKPTPPTAYYFPALVAPNANNLCPSCAGSSDFEQSIECSDFNLYQCGGVAKNGTIDTTINGNRIRQESHQGVQCLIKDPTQDQLSTVNFLAGTGPMEITAMSGPLSGRLVTTSRSIATIPIFDHTSFDPATGQVTVIGFMQAFIANATGSGDVTITILNVAGCGSSPGTGVAINQAGSVSAIPVRLIHQ